jgi:uncharacterized glyoxalase superfamily protein PhnB
VTEARAVSSEVVIAAVDPDTAFMVFTEELDLWWVRGPINFFSDAGRVVEVRCEPGVGGRLLEVYETGDGFERGRITVWEPGVRLGWDSSVDDVQTEVRFDKVEDGTRVTVEARIPAGGEDKGGTAWTRVVPPWFGAWCAKRDRVPHEQRDIARLALGVYYKRPAAAARWLANVFGFESVDKLPEGEDPLPEGEHGHPWIEFHLGNSSLMVFKRDGDDAVDSPIHVPWVYVDDLDAHLAHAEENGATILHRKEWPWLSAYVAQDLEGNQWTIAQARPTQR